MSKDELLKRRYRILEELLSMSDDERADFRVQLQEALRTPRSVSGGRTIAQHAVAIRGNELGRWWQSLSDTHRAALQAGRLSMMEEAFEAGARAALQSLEGEG